MGYIRIHLWAPWSYDMSKHIGKIINQAIKNSGYSVTYISKKLGINRGCLYNKLKLPNLPFEFIIQIGKIIRYDFSKHVPHISEYIEKKRMASITNIDNYLKDINNTKYNNLQNQYNSLLNFMTLLANEYNLTELKNSIKELIKK